MLSPSIIRLYQRFKRQGVAHQVGYYAQNCLQLAKAYHAAKTAGCQWLWEADNYCDYSFVDTWDQKYQDEWHKSKHVAEWCQLVDAEGNHLASLCGIIDADEDYRREIEAELAFEALDAIQSSYVI